MNWGKEKHADQVFRLQKLVYSFILVGPKLPTSLNWLGFHEWSLRHSMSHDWYSIGISTSCKGTGHYKEPLNVHLTVLLV